MNHFNDAEIRNRLEFLYQQSPSVPFYVEWVEFLRQIGTALVQQLVRDRTAPSISKYYTVDGKVIWYVVDPVTQQRATYRSEQEVQAWLDARRCQ